LNNIDFSKKYRPPDLTKDLISAHIQQKLIEDSFDWIKKSIVKDGSLIGKGKLKPIGCKNTYDIFFVYNPNKKGRQENIYVEDKKIKFGLVPHLYNNHSLCLYHPNDLSPFIQYNFIDTIPWISKWLVTYELWLKYGIWLDKEFKH
tara:strand:- start:358 stop:795 length:438 start_codon:yes stop_codon:yes gene_type:complete